MIDIKIELKKYESAVIMRGALIMILSAPVVVALIKLQGLYLDETMIGLIAFTANMFGMMNYWLNKKLDYVQLHYLILTSYSLVVLGTAIGFFNGVDPIYLLMYFCLLINGCHLSAMVFSVKVKNIIKDKAKEEFDISNFDNKKQSIYGAAGMIGQVGTMAFYYFTDFEPMVVIVVLEIVKMLIFIPGERIRFHTVNRINSL